MDFQPHHTGFSVSDMDQSIVFYRDLLGLQLFQDVVRDNVPSYSEILGFPDVRIRVALFRLSNSDHVLELVEYLHPHRQTREMKNTFVGAAHLCFVVPDLNREYQRLQRCGVTFNSPPVEIVREGQYIGKGVYMLDPDGISVEILEFPRS
jgi:catechol 2,3-dioxygenase-like lactoylglutathione lyase family enzyme